MALYIGMMAGTSVDAIDAAVVDFSLDLPQLIATHSEAFAPELRQQVLELMQPGDNEIQRMLIADNQLGAAFGAAANALLKKAALPKEAILAIGSHGQTIRHLPQYGNTLQIGNPNVIAELTGIPTISDFRRRDMAQGGQGAPLAPLFHHYVFAEAKQTRATVNIGGMANITVLPHDATQSVFGFDTGPGNVLLDDWTLQHLGSAFDKNGEWASTGQADPGFVATLLKDAYFDQAPPKSTGRERFNHLWLQQHLKEYAKALTPEDVQASLVELTAQSITLAIHKYAPEIESLFVCGGGALNGYLMQQLQAHAQGYVVHSTAALGIHPSWVEAMLMAWLAKQRFEGKACQLQAVTGAKGNGAILGGVYY